MALGNKDLSSYFGQFYVLSQGNQVEMSFQDTMLIGRWKHEYHRLLGRLILEHLEDFQHGI